MFYKVLFDKDSTSAAKGMPDPKTVTAEPSIAQQMHWKALKYRSMSVDMKVGKIWNTIKIMAEEGYFEMTVDMRGYTKKEALEIRDIFIKEGFEVSYIAYEDHNTYLKIGW